MFIVLQAPNILNIQFTFGILKPNKLGFSRRRFYGALQKHVQGPCCACKVKHSYDPASAGLPPPGLSLGTVNGVLHEAEDAGLIADGMLTIDGLKSLKPYEVENAIIMAAGLSSRLAPISYEKPKGLLRVRGEVLIERQIANSRRRALPTSPWWWATRRSTSSIWQVSLACASRSTRNMRRTTATPCGLCATASTTPTCARQMTTSRRILSSTTRPTMPPSTLLAQPRGGA